MKDSEFKTAVILRAPIKEAAVDLLTKQPRKPDNPSYMRGWCAVGAAVRRKK